MVQTLESAGVDGALIVQPINHKYDHAFVLEVNRFTLGLFR